MRADFRRLSHRGDGDATRLDGMNWKAITLSACFLILFLPSTSSASDYVARRAAAKQQCEAISPSESQSGLVLQSGWVQVVLRSVPMLSDDGRTVSRLVVMRPSAPAVFAVFVELGNLFDAMPEAGSQGH